VPWRSTRRTSGWRCKHGKGVVCIHRAEPGGILSTVFDRVMQFSSRAGSRCDGRTRMMRYGRGQGPLPCRRVFTGGRLTCSQTIFGHSCGGKYATGRTTNTDRWTYGVSGDLVCLGGWQGPDTQRRDLITATHNRSMPSQYSTRSLPHDNR